MSSSQGSWVRCDHAPPQASGRGPYGDGVNRHFGETPDRSGTGRAAGVHRYGDSPRPVRAPVAT